jgi:hypothetical protein
MAQQTGPYGCQYHQEACTRRKAIHHRQGHIYFQDRGIDTCAVAKTTCHTFDNVSVAGTQPLEIVHSDIAGPLKPDLNGHIYYMTSIDDFTGLTCINGLRHKSAMDVSDSFKSFKKTAELPIQKKVQCLHTDGSGSIKVVGRSISRYKGYSTRSLHFLHLS